MSVSALSATATATLHRAPESVTAFPYHILLPPSSYTRRPHSTAPLHAIQQERCRGAHRECVRSPLRAAGELALLDCISELKELRTVR